MRDDPDYDLLLDQETRAFVRRTGLWYPPETADLPVERQRDIYDAMCREFHTGYPQEVAAEDDVFEADGRTISLRRYRLAGAAPAARVVYLHGGGFVGGGLESHDDVCAELCAATGFDVTAVAYRLAPEHLHPAAFEDALDAVLHEWRRTVSPSNRRKPAPTEAGRVEANPAGADPAEADPAGTVPTGAAPTKAAPAEANRIEAVSPDMTASAPPLPIVLCGNSAGGNLAAAVAHRLRGEEIDIAGQVLIYPGLGGDPTRGSCLRHADAPMLTAREVQFCSGIRTMGEPPYDDPSFAPLADEDFANLPPTVVVTAECDPLSDDGSEYVERVLAAGGRAVHFDETGLVHGYLRARDTVGRARRSFARIVEAVAALGSGGWPYPDPERTGEVDMHPRGSADQGGDEPGGDDQTNSRGTASS